MPIDVSSRGTMTQILSKSADSFDKAIADGTTNEIDLASQYNFNPERLRLFRNGSRSFPHYNTVSQFEDKADVWTLKPDAGDNMHIESAESSTYTVQYDTKISFAFALNQSLEDGDKIRVGPYNDDDGWFMEQRGSDHTDNQLDIFRVYSGTETKLESNVELPRPTTEFHRYSCRFNWYNVGHQVWDQTYTNNGEQFNDIIAQTSADGEKATRTPNLNIWWEINADATTTGLEMDVGSGSIITYGNIVNLTRTKQQYESITLSGSADTWEPILAMRINPDNPNVNAQFTDIEVLQYGANDDVEIVVVSVDPDKTDASGFSTNGYSHSYNSAIQTTESISEVPDLNGVQKDLGSSDDPGGHTIGNSVLLSGGGQSEIAKTGKTGTQSKKNILSSDHTVFLGRSGTTGSDIEFTWEVSQNW